MRTGLLLLYILPLRFSRLRHPQFTVVTSTSKPAPQAPHHRSLDFLALQGSAAPQLHGLDCLLCILKADIKTLTLGPSSGR